MLTERITLGDACVAVVDCEHKTAPEDPIGPAWSIGTPAMKDGRIEYGATKRISLETYEGWTRRLRPEAGDLILAREAPVGPVVRVPPDRMVALGQRTVLLRPDPSIVDSRYLHFLLLSPEMQHSLRSMSEGSTVPHLNVADVRNFPLPPLPPLPAQRAIAEVLGALDDKIELNERMNATLDEMARALFKSWFVDFDPVRAKAEGREPSHMNAATAAPFPDSFEDSALGSIPMGWRVSTVGEIVSVFGGSTPSTKEPAFWDGLHAFATPKDLSQISTPVLLDTARRITDAGLAKISSGLLPADTVLMSSRAPVGYLAIARLPVAVNQGMAAMVCDGDVKPPFVLNWTRLNMEEIRSRASGTTFPEISKSSFRSIQCVMPPPEVHDAYYATTAPLYELITTNVSESRTLAELRDELLPRLISGEIRVTEPTPRGPR